MSTKNGAVLKKVKVTRQMKKHAGAGTMLGKKKNILRKKVFSGIFAYLKE